MRRIVLLAVLCVGCSSATQEKPTFDSTDPHGSIARLTVGRSEADVDRFCSDCMMVSTGQANLSKANHTVEHLPGHEIEAFKRLNGMTADQITDRAAALRAAVR